MLANASWVAPLRAQLPVVHRYVYLNSGTAGPIPEVSARAIASEAELELQDGRGNLASWGRMFGLIGRCRQAAARLLGAESDEIALTHHTSDGINIVLWGIDWQPGDRVVTTTLEHDAVAVPLGLLRERYGVQLCFADIGRGENALSAIDRVLDERTRLLVISHVAYGTGAELPVAALVARAHARGIPVLVDGAQTAGARPLDVHDLEVDYYTLSGQKWLGGPEGTGALYVRRDRIDGLRCTFASYFSARRHDFRGKVEWHQAAQRFETGIVYRPAWAGFAAGADWLLDEVGLDRAWQRSLDLTHHARALLQAIDGVTLVTPEAEATQLLSFDLPGFSPAQLWGLTAALAREQRIVIRSTPHPPWALRASIGWFNTPDELETLARAIAAAVTQGPDHLPIDGYGKTLPTTRD